LVWIGKRSYGIYLWQYTIQALAIEVRHPGNGTNEWNLMLFLLSIGVAAVSYRYIEHPFLAKKDSLRHVELARAVQAGDIPGSS
jgi:peptidoglycan/LPS O-acetylase OafA/YrhL